MAAEIEKKYGIKVELIPSSGGVFEVCRDGELIFSKRKTDRFPTTEEIFAALG